MIQVLPTFKFPMRNKNNSKEYLVLCEYDYLIKKEEKEEGEVNYGNRVTPISPHHYRRLEKLITRKNDDYGSFLKFTSYNGRPALQIQNYSGVLEVDRDLLLEILPKVGRIYDQRKSRLVLINMLKRLSNSPFSLAGRAHLKTCSMALIDVLIKDFLYEVKKLITKGIKSDYTTITENKNVLRGKLVFALNVRHNIVNRHKFFCSFDEFVPNCPENRIIRSSLEKALRLTRSERNVMLCRELLSFFQEIPPSTNFINDFSLCKTDRNSLHYKKAMSWCEIVLLNKSIVPQPGAFNTFSMIFPMEKVFEDYVGYLLRHTRNIYDIHIQRSQHYLIEEPKLFRLRPDFTFKINGENRVGDAKWKIIEDPTKDVSQSDLYQLFAYGEKYGADQLYMFYPKTNCFNEPIHWNFNKKTRISLIPVPLPDGDEPYNLNNNLTL